MDFVDILLRLLGIAKFFIFAHFLMSWLIAFNVLNVYQPIVSQIWGGLNKLLDPLYNPIRRVLPNFGGMDLSPLVVLFSIIILENFLR